MTTVNRQHLNTYCTTIVSRVHIGHVIRTESDAFTVVGFSNLRGRYRYTVKDATGARHSISRDDLMQAQREGSAHVVAL